MIDQAEEVFTLAPTPKWNEDPRQALTILRQNEKNREVALEMLRMAAAVPGKFKVIVSLRTEYHGRLIDWLRWGGTPVREYLLTDFTQDQLAEAVLRPTTPDEIPYTKDVPRLIYSFHYGPGVAEEIACRLVVFCSGRQDSVLPLAQMICMQLYEIARELPNHEISLEDFERIGGVEGGMVKHVEGLLSRILPHPADRNAFKRLFRRLYRRQPDMTLPTALVPMKDLADRWKRYKGRRRFEEIVQLASQGDCRLLRVNSFRLGGQEFRPYVSLGHDALAPVAAKWDEERERAARHRKLIRNVLISVAIILGPVMAGLAAYALNKARLSETESQKKSQYLYVAELYIVQSDWRQGNIPHMRYLLKPNAPWTKSEGKDLRGFKWYYWWRLCNHRTLDHPEAVKSIAFSPDGKTLASGGGGEHKEDKIGEVKLWDVATGKEQAILPGHTGLVYAVVFSPSPEAVLRPGQADYLTLSAFA